MINQFPLEKEYAKHPDTKPDDVLALRSWLRTQPHLPEQRITDLELLLAYHACDQSMEVTKQVVDLHYTLRSQLPFLQDLVFRDDRDFQLGLLAFLPASPGGNKVIYSRIHDTDPKNFTMMNIARLFVMLTDLWLHEQGSWPGFVFVIDMAGISLGHMAKVDLTVVQHFLYYLQEAIFVKVKSVHFINAPGFMDSLMRLLKPFLSSSILDLIHVHKDHKIEGLGAEALPKEAGGTWKDVATLMADQVKTLKENAKFFEENSKKVVNEAKRPGKQKSLSDIFGIQGSFKKLDID